MLEDESEDVLGLVVQAMKMFPVNEEVQLHGCGALQVLLETGQVGEVFHLGELVSRACMFEGRGHSG